MRPIIDQVFDFENAKDAFIAMQKAKHFGKLVIRI
jgi:NADPH:quinone reductase-like Zn-dependent oxidoreductase